MKIPLTINEHISRLNGSNSMIMLYSQRSGNVKETYPSSNIFKMEYTKKYNCFINCQNRIKINRELDSKNGNSIFKRINSLLNILPKPKMYVQSKFNNFHCDILQFSRNRIQMIDIKSMKIINLLIPGADKEWFLKDLKIQKMLNQIDSKLLVPRIYESNNTNLFFISEYIITSSKPHHIVDKRQIYERISTILFKFYNETNRTYYLDLSSAVTNIVQEFRVNIKSISTAHSTYSMNQIDRLVDAIKKTIKGLKQNERIVYTNIIHGDVNLEKNILISKDGYVYFLDWELSRNGNILYDFFYMLFHENYSSDNLANWALTDFFLDKEFQLIMKNNISRYLGYQINQSDFLGYFLLTFLDMLVYKVLVIKKKRLRNDKYEEFATIRIESIRRMLTDVVNLLSYLEKRLISES